MAFELNKYPSAESAKKAIEEQLPTGVSRNKVLSFLDVAGIKCFDVQAEILACRVIGKSTTMVHVVWQLAFHFDDRGKLVDVRVTRGFVGP